MSYPSPLASTSTSHQDQVGHDPVSSVDVQDEEGGIIYIDPSLSIPLSTQDGNIDFFFQPVPTLQKRSNNRSSKSNTEKKSSLLAGTGLSKFHSECLSLQCEWRECVEMFQGVKDFSEHVGQHIKEAELRLSLEANPDGPDDESSFACLWRICDFETPSSTEMVRHVHFHAFHTKIKCHGKIMLDKIGVTKCTLDPDQRNILPDVIDPFLCLWEDCDCGEREFPEALAYYAHVRQHGESTRGEKSAECKWKDCPKREYNNVSKLKEHLRSHSLERTVGCPTCGALFSSRSKFYDHCKRQVPNEEMPHKCSYCNKRFAIERHFREHVVRAHVSHYKCPLCDMTCPLPSNLRAHMAYKHSEERNFNCDVCNHKAKSLNDLTTHMRKHYGTKEVCTYEGCDATFACKSNLKHHIRQVHEKEGPSYCCHLCERKFNRGYYLTKHLKKIHSYSWPSGHSRFRYKKDPDGLFRLQTERFESAELSEMLTIGEEPPMDEAEVDDPGNEQQQQL